MRYVKFKMETDQEYTGEVGIVPNIHSQWEHYIPTQPFGLGHDLLDHASNERGHFYQEMAALGSAAFRTNFGNHIPSLISPYAEACAWDFVSSLRDSQETIDAPKYNLTKEEKARLDKLLTDVRPLAIDAWMNELRYDDEYDEGYNFFEVDENWNRICNWYKYGFARAKRRFKGDAWSMHTLRERIKRVVQEQWQTLIEFCDSGREFTLALDYENGYVEVRGLPW